MYAITYVLGFLSKSKAISFLDFVKKFAIDFENE